MIPVLLKLNFILKSVVRKLGDGIEPLGNQIMTIILRLIQSAGKTSTVLEDAFLVVGTMASGMSSSCRLSYVLTLIANISNST